MLKIRGRLNLTPIRRISADEREMVPSLREIAMKDIEHL